MQAVIVGGGASGVAIQRACEAEGIRARQVSRSTGFDVTADSLPQLEADVVIEATNIVATGRKPCIEFFERSARSVAHAAAQAGARHIRGVASLKAALSSFPKEQTDEPV